MNYKVDGAIKKTKKYIIIYLILWLFCVIVFVMPLGVAIAESGSGSSFNIGNVIAKFSTYALKPFSSFGKVFLPSYFISFVGVLWKFTLLYIIIEVIGMIRNAPKSEYEDIEHGSSDWATNGEQYKVLSNKKGIILGENNYLPVDKRGNVNVLVVGRFRIW